MACRAKRRTKKAWDQEWGKIETEGNLWWAGSMRKNWEEVMGPTWWKWLREFSFFHPYLSSFHSSDLFTCPPDPDVLLPVLRKEVY